MRSSINLDMIWLKDESLEDVCPRRWAEISEKLQALYPGPQGCLGRRRYRAVERCRAPRPRASSSGTSRMGGIAPSTYETTTVKLRVPV